MCHGDLSPVTTIYCPQIDSTVLNSEQWHICRKYNPIRRVDITGATQL